MFGSYILLVGTRFFSWFLDREGMHGQGWKSPARACVLLPLWVEIHDAHYHDFLAWPHASFDVPTERDNLEKDCRESK